MRRYDCLKAIAPLVADSLVITNLANTATEWRSVRPQEGKLYFVGMGMGTPYAAGLALALPNRRGRAPAGRGRDPCQPGAPRRPPRGAPAHPGAPRLAPQWY